MSGLNSEKLNNENITNDQGGSIRPDITKVSASIESVNPSSITSKIGKGEDAKNSIIWTIITWCLAIPAGITFLYFITMWLVLYWFPKPDAHIEAIRDHIIKIWSLFSPIITLALGYLYGKSSKDEDKNS